MGPKSLSSGPTAATAKGYLTNAARGDAPGGRRYARNGGGSPNRSRRRWIRVVAAIRRS